MIVRMQLLTPAGRRPGARQMAVMHSRSKREGFWKIEEPEIAAVFEGRDIAYFEAERVSDEEIKIIRRVDDEDW